MKTPIRLTCYQAHDDLKVDCNREECVNWIKHTKSSNCVINAANQGPMTLQEIGDIFGVTRMRICQIEKIILGKLSNSKDLPEEDYA